MIVHPSWHRVVRIVVVTALVAAAACSSKKTAPTTGSGSTGGAGGGSSTCDGIRDKVTALYRAEAAARPGKHVGPTYVEDNTTMVLADCAQEPDRVAGCVAAASTVAMVEQCLTPLDDEGTEGDVLAR